MRFGLILAAVFAVFPLAAVADHGVNREILQEHDLSDAPDMKVVISRLTIEPGGRIPLHSHAGDEHGVIIKGGRVQLPNGTETTFEDGTTVFFSAGDVHGGITNLEDYTMEVLSTHIVRVTEPFQSPAE